MKKNLIFCGHRQFEKGIRPLVMGVINVTPDSFSDGGLYVLPKNAVQEGMSKIAQGADVLDVGAVSTAPNRVVVGEQEELDRLIPVIEGLVKEGVTNISVDTMRAQVAKEALKRGASWINDQSAGLFDENMPLVMAEAHGVVIMHNGGGKTSGVDAGEGVFYQDIIQDIHRFFADRIEALKKSGVNPKRIIVDPGIGFGKGLRDSLAIVNGMKYFTDLGYMSLIGVSRKSMIGKLSGIEIPSARDIASLGAVAVAIMGGADIVRVHNVSAMVEFLKVFCPCLKFNEGTGDDEDIYQTW